MPFDPRRTCRKNTGPRDPSLMQSATAANSGARNSSPSVAATRSNVRLRIRDERESLVGLSPTSGIPSSVCTSAPPPKTSKYRGTMSICTSRSRIARMFASTASCESFENAKITRSTPCSVTHSRRRSGPPSSSGSRCASSSSSSVGRSSTKPTRLMPYSRWFVQLQRELLADVPRADDDGVLLVARAGGGRASARRRAASGSGRPRASQKTPSRASTGCTRSRGDAEESEDPDPDRDAAEDTDDVVDRRVVGPLLVPVVEPLEPEEEEPAGDREQERDVLEAGGDPVGRPELGRKHGASRRRTTRSAPGRLRPAASGERVPRGCSDDAPANDRVEPRLRSGRNPRPRSLPRRNASLPL